MSKIFGYCRCSTDDSKQDVTRQIRDLVDMGATPETIYKEYVSGMKEDKIELNRMLDAMSSGDTVVVTEISRITRSTKQLIAFIDILKARHFRLQIKDSITIDCRNGEDIDPMTKAMLQIAGVFAELERDMISERVKSGMRSARAKRESNPDLNPIGRPKITFFDIPFRVKKRYQEYLDGNLNKSEYARICGVSRPTICKYIAIMKDYYDIHKPV